MTEDIRDDFYPIILATIPPTVLTREDVGRYFEQRNTVVNITCLPAIKPFPEDGK
jgi:hypothetical protein